MNPFRRVLRYILASLARYAIGKHKIELIVIAGWYGTDIARELAYTVLNDTLKVRRNTTEIWWDFSLPLAILGYADKRRSILGWLLLLVRASLYLTFSRANPHTLILNADCTYDHTAKYWASFVKPEYLVILNYDRDAAIVRELMRSTDPDKATVIYNPDAVPANMQQKLKNYTSVTFGENAKNSVVITTTKGQIQASASGAHTTLPIPATMGVTESSLGAVFGLAVANDVDIAEAAFNSLKFELPTGVLAKIRSNLEVTAAK